MSQTFSNRWVTDPEYIELLNYLINKTKDAKPPINIYEFIRDFKKKSGTELTDTCLKSRIQRMRAIIHSFEHIETDTKVRMLFVLSVPVNGDFLKKLANDALVEVDGNNRITVYKSERLELEGYHRVLMARETERYWTTDLECIDLLNYLIEETENVKSPMSLAQLARDFKEKSGTFQTAKSLEQRIVRVRFIIRSFKHIDEKGRVKLTFALSDSIDAGFLKQLKKNAVVEVDDEKRITHYKSNDGSLELKGDHSQSAKTKTALFESKRSLRSLIVNYFETKDDANAIRKNKQEKEMGNLIEFISEKCLNVDKPINIRQLIKDFENHFGISVPLNTVRTRIEAYCLEIQGTEFLDIQTKVKQLFGLSIKLDSICLKELRKNAIVEVDQKNRIIGYMSNDGSLTLRGRHRGSKRGLSRCVEKTDKDNTAAMTDNSEEENDNEIFNDSSDEHSGEKVDSEFDSGDENDPLDEPEDLTEPLNKTGLDNETPVRNRSPSEMSIDDKFGSDPLTEKSHKSEETEKSEDKGNDPGNTKNAVIKTRSGRLSKKRHLDSEFSYDLASFGSSESTMNTHSASSKPAKQKKIGIEKDQASFSSPDYNSLELQVDYDTNYSINDEVKLEPFRGEVQKDLKGIVDDKDIQQIPKPIETPIKIEVEEPIEIKPETSHNSEIKFFEAMHSLIVCLDTPSLSEIQSKVHQKIHKNKGLDEVILNNEIVQIVDSLISQMSSQSVVNLSENAESVNLSNFLCYLKASILNSKMIGVEGLVKNISELIEESQNKRIPMKNVANAFCTLLNIDGF